MDTGKMLIPLSAATMKKVTTSHSLFGSDLVCSDTTNECIHLVGDRFGYNSEKQFNNPLFFKRHCNQKREMAVVNSQKVLNPNPGGTMPKLTACHSPFFGSNEVCMQR